MGNNSALSDHLAPDSIRRLQRAARLRFELAVSLSTQVAGRLTAVYLLGFSAEMCLTAAFFRRTGFTPEATIDRDTRQRRMAQARQLKLPNGEPLMTGDPHPLVGWARLLQRQRSSDPGLPVVDRQRLSEAIKQAERIYRHWRPELRYKTIEVSSEQLNEVRFSTEWLIEQMDRL